MKINEKLLFFLTLIYRLWISIDSDEILLEEIEIGSLSILWLELMTVLVLSKLVVPLSEKIRTSSGWPMMSMIFVLKLSF